jgi:ParB family transcriptional regulator, chromosome partitioning protein
MTDTERETARAERRRVIESNKAWKAATDVRRGWLTSFAARKTAPAGAGAYLAQAVVQGWTADPASTDALPLVGHRAPDGLSAWTRASSQATALLATLDTASPKRALQVALAVAVATWEVRTQPQTWRNPDPHTVATLTCLQQWGYPLSEIEQQMTIDH